MSIFDIELEATAPAADLRRTAARRLGRLARAALSAVAVVWVAASFTFLVQALLPGDRAVILINIVAGTITNPTPEQIAAVNAQYGFDAPLYVQYLRYIGGLAVGDLGMSYLQHKPVLEVIGAQVLPTVVLALSALATAWMIAIALTLAAAGRPGFASRLATGAQILLATAPPYWLGTLLLVLFAVKLGLFPVEGRNSLAGLVLPTLSLALPLAGFIGQAIQDEFARVLEQPFVTSARTRGMSDLGVRLGHVLRHAVLPGISLSGWAVGKLLSGAVLVEAVFARQGIGGILVNATSARDVPVVSGIVVLSAAAYVIINMGVDAIYRLVDRRIALP
ncbi:ABC transporter permease [Xanthobacter sp. V4C-4]|uniref:ABC transporter permease n=1 Tax=Xanthobacter cornucopiae TaxID=3119924 RepID=UPI00372A7237